MFSQVPITVEKLYGSSLKINIACYQEQHNGKHGSEKEKKCKMEDNYFSSIFQRHLSEKTYNKNTWGTTQSH